MQERNKTIVIATHNRHKLAEIEALLSPVCPGYAFRTLEDVGIFGDIEEDGDTFEENAVIKAKTAADAGYIGIADDSGLEVDALHGAPGVFSARYAGEPCDDAANNEKLLRELSSVPDEKRTARFVSVIALCFPKEENGTGTPKELVVRGECEGVILHAYRGTGGFGYDPLFFCPEVGKTFAEVTQKEKNTVSHRARAMQRFADAVREKQIFS